MPNWVIGIGQALIPTTDHSPKQQYQWRLRVGLVLCATFTGLVSVTLLAFGLLPGFAGFAQAGELQAVVKEVRAGRAQALDAQILDMRIRQCAASSSEAKQLYWSKIAPLTIEYQNVTGKTYPLPACSDL